VDVHAVVEATSAPWDSASTAYLRHQGVILRNRHLVVRAVPASQRVPLFEQAAGLLDEAGWGLDELVAAAEPGPARDTLLQTLGLLDG